MNSFRKIGQGLWVAVMGLGLLMCVARTQAQPVTAATNEIRIVELQGVAEIASGTAAAWKPAHDHQVLHPFDRLRTSENSRVAVLWSDRSVVSFGALTEIEILPADSPDAQSGLHLIRGILSFFHRDKPGRIRVITRGAVAGVEGTEFAMAADRGDRTALSVIDGKVRFGNAQGTIVLTNGEQAVAEPGKAPARTAGFIANNVLQWCFYYPAVIDPAELQLAPDEEKALAASLQAYRSGDLLAALAQYPANLRPASDAERLYYAGLLLSVGQVAQAESVLDSLSNSNPDSRPQRMAAALRRLVAAVKRQTAPTMSPPQLATEFLARSYYEQSRAIHGVSLRAALNSARQAATVSPDFSYAWERVAELEFSFGNTRAALQALNKSLALAPRNAQALALTGFVLASQNHTGDAIGWFDRALAVDSALGNAWLGRGLCRIRNCDLKGGREDLLVAAALEPQRAELRDYLGKAYADEGNDARAAKELERAKTLDPNDPTAWLYSALLNQQDNRINDAIGDLEKSEALNDNRSVYRSHLLLDQDRAVRSANLAAMYQDAGMDDWAVNEASRAVNYDYANYSAHLFLANSFSTLTDPNEINLRYETPAESEYLLANLLSPVSAGTLSPEISQQEYSPLFERNGFGVVSSTEYLSRGAWTESGTQYGTFGNFGYAVGGYYRTDPGQYVNNDTEQRQLSGAFKYEVTPQDTVYLQVKQYEANSGDLSQYYDPNNQINGANPAARVNEDQTPIVGLGYHHEWSPGVHTVLYAARLKDSLSVANPAGPTYLTIIPFGTITAVDSLTMNEQLKDDLTIYSAELQQIWQTPKHNTVVGARFQYGNFDIQNVQNNPSSFAGIVFPGLPDNVIEQNVTSMFRRFSVYGYHQWQILEPLQLIGGVAYDRLTYPDNFQSAPVSANTKSENRVSPKAGLIFTPFRNTTFRFAYTRSLAGASIDQDYQLEPSQVAGFIQNYRSIIPESVAGPIPGTKFETYGISLEQKLPTRTYLTISGELLNSMADQTLGAFDYFPLVPSLAASGINKHLDYTEQSLHFTANQLLGREWAVGARYSVSDVVLNENVPDAPNPPLFGGITPSERQHSILNQADLLIVYNHPCGFFAQGEAHWYDQSNSMPGEPGDDFWQLNAYVGYRFLHRHAQFTLGVLNITDQNYNLAPLNYYNELPRSRTLLASLQLNF